MGSASTVRPESASDTALETWANACGDNTSGANGIKLPEAPRMATWLQRQMAAAKQWEEAHCPAPAEAEAYQWKKATSDWARLSEERRQRRQGGTSHGGPGNADGSDA